MSRIYLQAKKLTFHERYLLGDAPFLVEFLIQDLRTRRPHLYNSNKKKITNNKMFFHTYLTYQLFTMIPLKCFFKINISGNNVISNVINVF